MTTARMNKKFSTQITIDTAQKKILVSDKIPIKGETVNALAIYDHLKKQETQKLTFKMSKPISYGFPKSFLFFIENPDHLQLAEKLIREKFNENEIKHKP